MHPMGTAALFTTERHGSDRNARQQRDGQRGCGAHTTEYPEPCETQSRQSSPALCDPCGLHSPWDSPGQSTGVGSLSLLQGTFPTQGSNPSLPHFKRIVYRLSHKESP